MNEIRDMLRATFSLESGSDTPDSIREKMISGAKVRGTNMCILVLAIFIASIGLNMNSTAVIIGAMLISPLMGGIMAVGYGIAVNDLPLTRRAFLGLLVQVFLCIVTSMLYFSLSPISTAHSELLARTTPSIWDVMIAVCGGLAGVIGVTREEKTNVLPGVAIATALMPPLCTAGFGLATGSISFFIGAMYLFFINSFFICVGTVFIVRVMRLPRKKFIDRKARHKAVAIISVIAVITVIPSIYLAWQIVNESVTDSNISRYLSQQFTFADTQVVRSYANKKDNVIHVALLGKRLSSDQIGMLESELNQYGLSQMTLKVTQTELEQGVSYEDIQSLIDKELVENAKQTNLIAQSKELEDAKADLVKYKMQLLEYQSYDYNMEALSKEIRSLYPQVETCSIGRHKAWDEARQQTETSVVLTLRIPERDKLDIARQEQLISWLEVKLNVSPIYLYQDIIPAPPGEEAEPDESSLPVDMAEADEAASSGETADMGNPAPLL